MTACDRSLENLGTDYIDLYQIHWPSRKVPLEESWRALEQLKQDGKVLKVGTEEWREAYGARVEKFIKKLRAANVAVYWVGLPVMRSY